jgi:soluble lytic murein transglycosylase-like protein
LILHLKTWAVALCAASCEYAAAQVLCVDTQGRAMVINEVAVEYLKGYRCETPAARGDQQVRDAFGLKRAALATVRPQSAGALTAVEIESRSLRLTDPGRGRAPRRVALGEPVPRRSSQRALDAGASALPGGVLDSIVSSAARQFRHDVRLLKAIIQVESNFNPGAVSNKGAIGLMQVMPATGKRLGVEDPGTQLFDPATNVNAGAKYLRYLMDMFADQPTLAIAAYNAGEGAVERYNRRIPPFRETQDYVRRVLAHYATCSERQTDSDSPPMATRRAQLQC